MNRRIARKILNNMIIVFTPLGGGGIISHTVPKHFGLYHKACETLKEKPYYDKVWWASIMARRIKKMNWHK